MQSIIKNFEGLATSESRRKVLSVLEAGIHAIDTKSVIREQIKIEENFLYIQGRGFDLSQFKRIKVIGFGKASCDAAIALEEVLGAKITQGIVIGLETTTCAVIETFAGSHPRPTHVNTLAGEKIYKIAKESTAEDLLIVVVSGGGSALLCATDDECESLARLYDAFLEHGGNITEMNTVRKHLSTLKGGGLAKLSYPATVIGLVFSDVPGDNFQDVASGPTYLDTSTVADAQRIITEKGLGEYELLDTTKDPKYFEKVYNFILVENKTAVNAMQKCAQNICINTKILSTELYSDVEEVARTLCKAENGVLVLAAGEPKVRIIKKGGSGGRNMYLCHSVLAQGLMREGMVFASLASDGLDNSDLAGAIVDTSTLEKINTQGLDIKEYYENYDSYNFFKHTDDLIDTGATGANVSDVMVVFSNNE